MARLLFIIVLFLVSLVVLKYVRKAIDDHTNKRNQAKLNQSTKAGDMLKCQHCDLHIPKNEAIRQGDNVFCSLEHARKHLE